MSGSSSVNYMHSVIRKRSPKVAENFSRTTFLEMLDFRSVRCDVNFLESLMEMGIVCPRKEDTRGYFHRGHLLLVILYKYSSHLVWHPWEVDYGDESELLMRRALLQEWIWSLYRADVEVVNRFFSWIWSDDISAFSPTDAAYIRALINGVLKIIDTDGKLEKLGANLTEQKQGLLLLVHDLVCMRSEVGRLLSDARDARIPIGDVQHVENRAERIDSKRSILCPVSAPYILSPQLDITAEERNNFLSKRNKLILDEDWRGLAEFYNVYEHLFEGDASLHEQYLLCQGDLFGGRCEQFERAIECFEAVLSNNDNHVYAFDQLRFFLRQAERWQDLSDLLSNRWDSVENVNERGSYLHECAEIFGFELGNYERSLELYERSFIDGCNCDEFEKFSTILSLAEELPATLRFRGLAALTAHIKSDDDARYIAERLSDLQLEEEKNEQFAYKLTLAGISIWQNKISQALSLLQSAIAMVPSDPLWLGTLRLVVQRASSLKEVMDGLSSLSHAIDNPKNLGHCLERIGVFFLELGRPLAALEVFEKAVECDPENLTVIQHCIQLSESAQKKDRVLLYRVLLCEQLTDSDEISDQESAISELRLGFEEDEIALANIYERMLGFELLREKAESGLVELVARIQDKEALLNLLERLESFSRGATFSWISRIYSEALSRDFGSEDRKTLLENYLSLLSHLDDKNTRQAYMETHAQLFALSPSESRLLALKDIKPSLSESKRWVGLVEDHISELSSSKIQVEAYRYLCKWISSELNDEDYCACLYEKMLTLDPSDVETFKKCFNSYEKLDRQYDWVGLVRGESLKYLCRDERIQSLRKALKPALVNMGDPQVICELLVGIASEDERFAVDSVKDMQGWSEEAKLPADQMESIWNVIEQQGFDVLFGLARVARFECLLNDGRKEAALRLVDERLKNALNSLPDHKKCIEAGVRQNKDIKGYHEAVQCLGMKLETAPLEKSPVASTPLVTRSPSDLLVLLRENGSSPELDNEIEAALKGFEKPVLAGNFLVELAQFYEEIGANDAAEGRLKKAFALNQSDLQFVNHLSEFYKRNNMFRKAVKMLNYKLAKEQNTDQQLAARLELATCYENLGDIEKTAEVYASVIQKSAALLGKPTIVQLYRKLANLKVLLGDIQAAIDTLKQASLVADLKTREELDLDGCFLLREKGALDEAKRVWQSLRLRNVRGIRLDLLSLSFDIDAEKYTEAQKNLTNYLAQEEWEPYKLLLLEQQLRVYIAQGAERGKIESVCKAIIELNPAHPEALHLLHGN